MMKEMIYGCNPPEIIAKSTYRNMRVYIISNRLNPCAYIVIPNNDEHCGVHYSSIPTELNICHGGLTYSNIGLPNFDDEDGNWVLGWDYGHAGDYVANINPEGKRYSTDEIVDDCINFIDNWIEYSKFNAAKLTKTRVLIENLADDKCYRVVDLPINAKELDDILCIIKCAKIVDDEYICTNPWGIEYLNSNLPYAFYEGYDVLEVSEMLEKINEFNENKYYKFLACLEYCEDSVYALEYIDDFYFFKDTDMEAIAYSHVKNFKDIVPDFFITHFNLASYIEELTTSEGFVETKYGVLCHIK